MTANPSAYRRAAGFMIALMILGVIDLVLSLIDGALAARGLAGLVHPGGVNENEVSGMAAVVLMAQALLRMPSLILRALWTRRLASNLHLYQAFAISPSWAWAGFFVPVASLWHPVRALSALARASGQRGGVLGGLALAWGVARWLTCPSGAVFVFLAMIVTVVYRQMAFHQITTGAALSLIFVLVLAVAGVVASALGLVIAPWIGRRQPKLGQLQSAEVFT